jgi:hypothetical protein
METKETKKASTKNLDAATKKAIINKSKKEEKRETTVKEKNFLYKFQLEETKLTDKESKKKRNKIRRNLQLIVNKIILDKKKVNIKENVQEFLNFYKANYILNDFTLKSLTNKNDEITLKEYSDVLHICKENLKTK